VVLARVVLVVGGTVVVVVGGCVVVVELVVGVGARVVVVARVWSVDVVISFPSSVGTTTATAAIANRSTAAPTAHAHHGTARSPVRTSAVGWVAIGTGRSGDTVGSSGVP
jgi:hypothetical protein